MPAWNLDTEITAQRTHAAYTFNDTCIILRLTETSDGQGGLEQAWAAVGTVACRIAANSGNNSPIAESFQQTGEYVLTVPYDTDLVASDKVTIDAYVYRVTFVDDVRDWKTALRATVSAEIDQ